jgi:hypothetical protein
MDTDAENLRITFVDESRDDIHPAQGIPGQKHFITIISDELPGILRLFTGRLAFVLLQDPGSVSITASAPCLSTKHLKHNNGRSRRGKKCSRMRVKATSQLRRPPSQKALSVVFQLTFFPRYHCTLDPDIRRYSDRRINETLGVTRLSGVVEMFRQ